MKTKILNSALAVLGLALVSNQALAQSIDESVNPDIETKVFRHSRIIDTINKDFEIIFIVYSSK